MSGSETRQRDNADTTLRARRLIRFSIVLLLFLFISCKTGMRRSGIPADAQAVLDTAIEDIDAGRYDKVYQDAADEWRAQLSAEDSRARLQELQQRLGKARTRAVQSAREEQTSTAPVAGHSVTVFYQTTFDRGTGMETFVLVERDGRWYLAKYYVSSSGLK